MGGRVVEGGSLENYCTLTRTLGSNPSPSASQTKRLLSEFSEGVFLCSVSLATLSEVERQYYEHTYGGSEMLSTLLSPLACSSMTIKA